MITKKESKICKRLFIGRNELRKHITVHEGEKCQSCNKSFTGVQKLMNHIHTIHESHKNYKCESCGKSFTTLGNLKKHIHTIHNGNKDYKCESCGKSFSHAWNLKKHLQSSCKSQRLQM